MSEQVIKQDVNGFSLFVTVCPWMNILPFMIQSMSFVKTFLIQESKLIDFLKTTWVSSQDKFY